MIELQPRGQSGEAMLAKVNEIVTKFNAQEKRIADLENTIRSQTKVINPDSWDAAMASLNLAVSTLEQLAKESAR